jgi:hypothetical protein
MRYRYLTLIFLAFSVSFCSENQHNSIVLYLCNRIEMTVPHIDNCIEEEDLYNEAVSREGSGNEDRGES